MFTREGESKALASYERIVTGLAGLKGKALLQALRATLDLDQFLRWLALMSVLENGDYVDELIFYATDSVGADGKPSLYYSVMGWDPDDLFSNCHHQGRFAIDDPHGLLYCAEGVLEHRIFEDALVYERYVSVLEEVMTQVDQERFERALDATLKEVLPFFAKNAIRDAMVEFLEGHPDATSDAEAKRVIQAAATQMKERFAARSQLLRERIAAYRAP
jgi:hypothetical protein